MTVGVVLEFLRVLFMRYVRFEGLALGMPRVQEG